jgi:tRNA G46 methylase TrmB
LRGRKAADAAFWFALAGVTDTSLMESLANICAKELERFGSRPSCRPKDILHVMERLAAAGIRSTNAVLQQAVLAALASKEHLLNPCDLLNFHSDHSLVMIWRFSTRQRKQRAFLKSALQHWERHSGESKSDTSFAVRNDKALPKTNWSDFYKDPTRPLVVDIGCGMGVSLLGLAQCDDDSASSLGDWSEYNYAGVDLSGLAIGYARGLSYRWGLEDRLQFFVDDAESFMKRVVDSYPGPVRFCVLQFPTPYRLQQSDFVNDNNENLPPSSERKGNSQLPSDVTSGFMVTKQLVRLIHGALRKGCANGTLLIQSNCEDVAVWMRQMACDEIGFQYIQSNSEPEALSPQVRMRTPKRTLDWIAMGGERAEGKGWSTRAILPRIGRTETEVACMLNGTPVHRCLLVPVESAVRQ